MTINELKKYYLEFISKKEFKEFEDITKEYIQEKGKELFTEFEYEVCIAFLKNSKLYLENKTLFYNIKNIINLINSYKQQNEILTKDLNSYKQREEILTKALKIIGGENNPIFNCCNLATKALEAVKEIK